MKYGNIVYEYNQQNNKPGNNQKIFEVESQVIALPKQENDCFLLASLPQHIYRIIPSVAVLGNPKRTFVVTLIYCRSHIFYYKKLWVFVKHLQITLRPHLCNTALLLYGQAGKNNSPGVRGVITLQNKPQMNKMSVPLVRYSLLKTMFTCKC